MIMQTKNRPDNDYISIKKRTEAQLKRNLAQNTLTDPWPRETP